MKLKTTSMPTTKHLFSSFMLLFSLLFFNSSLQAASILNANIAPFGQHSGGNTCPTGPSDLTGDDCYSSAIPVGFPFQFFGANKSDFYVSTNGVAFFSNPSTAYDNKSTLLNDSLAVMWDDLMSYRTTKTPARDDFVFYKIVDAAPNRKLVIQWNNYGIFQSEQEFGTMQAILYEGSNKIQFHYISLLTLGRSDGASGTVGIRSAGGTQIVHSHNQAVLTQGMSICYVPSGGSYTESVSPGADCPFPGTPLTNQSTPPPDKPTNLSRSVTTFSWNVAAHATSYRLIVSTNSNLNSPACDLTVTTTSKDASSCLTIVPGTTYFWAVEAINSAGATFSDTQHFSSTPPVAVADTYSIHKNGTLTVTLANGVLANDTGASTAIKLSDPAHSTSFSFNADGTFSYTPDASFNPGDDYTDSFTYKASNADGDSSPATVTITVLHNNHAPTAQADAYSTPEDTPLNVATANGVLANDLDIDVHDHLTAIVVSPTSNGTLKLNVDGSLIYTPNANYNGTDSFTYKANDGHLDSNTVTAEIIVKPINDAPVALPDSYGIAEDTPLKVDAALGLLRNDTDADGNQLSAVKVTDPSHGLLLFNSDGSIEYTPNSDFNGDDSFTYKANDGQLDSAVVTVFIHVSPVNDAPLALQDAYSVHEDTGLIIDAANGLLKNDLDPEHSPLTVKLVNNVSHGTLHLNKDGSFDYTPALDYNGQDSFTYRANDGQLDSSIVTVNLTIDAVNDAPIAVSDSYTVFEDTLLSVDATKGLLANDSDPDGDSLIALLELTPTNGTVQFNLDGSFTYHPDANFNGTDFFSYKANDGKLDSTLTIVNLTVHALNDAPLGGNDSYSTQEDTAIKVVAANGVLANDIDFDGDILRSFITSFPSSGQVNLSLDGSFIYTPDKNFNGTDSFTYLAFDGVADSGDITVTINVHAVNDAPVAADDSYSVGEDGFLKVTVASGLLANDQDADGNVLRVGNIVSSVSHGALQLSLDGSFTYKPAFGFFGTDSFTYKANDGQADSNEVTVTITVNHINHPTLPNSDAYSIPQDSVLNVTTTKGLLANDLDIDGDTLLVTNIPTSVSHGTLQMVLDGSFTYTPDSGYSGPDSFTYIVNDGSVDSGPVTVSLNVTHVNHAPLAANDAYSLAQDGVLSIPPQGLLINDLDIDGDSLFVLIQSFPVNGALHQDLDGGFTYTPAPGFQGTDSYTYIASDGQLNSNVVTVTLTVNHSNHAPLAGDDSYSTSRDTVLQIDSSLGLLNNDIDPDGDTLTAMIVQLPQHGTLQLDPDGGFKYTPASGFAGLDSFTYKAKDSLLESNIATVMIDVNFTNRPPVAVDDQYSIARDTLLQASPANGMLANDTDPDGNVLQAIILTQPQHGTLHPLINGGFTYQPDAGYAGSDSFTYQANDGNVNSNTANVAINVNATNRPPVTRTGSYTAIEGLALQVAAPGVLASATDPDGDLLKAFAVRGPTHGTLHLNLDGSFTYTPDSGYTGKDSFTYKASDGHSDSAETLVSLDIKSALDPDKPEKKAKPIPTLSQWAQVFLALLLAGIAGFRLRNSERKL